MSNKSELLQRRLNAFGVAVCQASRRLPRDPAGLNLARQLVRAGTSPVANYAEAREAESNSDYVHRVKVCVKELRESDAWLSMAEGLTGGRLQADAVRKECSELIAIFVTCLKKAREHK